MMPKMPNQKENVKYIPKTITIRSDQNDFLRKKSINLSRFVQQKIDEESNSNKAKK